LWSLLSAHQGYQEKSPEGKTQRQHVNETPLQALSRGLLSAAGGRQVSLGIPTSYVLSFLIHSPTGSSTAGWLPVPEPPSASPEALPAVRCWGTCQIHHSHHQHENKHRIEIVLNYH